jgi:hypothetical protein
MNSAASFNRHNCIFFFGGGTLCVQEFDWFQSWLFAGLGEISNFPNVACVSVFTA